jgi:hypothetical protein
MATKGVGGGRDRVRRLQVTVSASERAGITARATSLRMSVSAYLRAAGLTQEMADPRDHRVLRLLAAVHGDLGRLAGAAPEGLKTELVALRTRLAAALEELA